MKFLFRADDLGLSKGVNYGIADAAENGIVRNIGLMMNMPDIAHGYRLVKDMDLCLGVHVNISVGRPLADDVPSLVDENGDFYSSGVYRSRSEDLAKVRDVFREASAQAAAFCDLTGKKPAYLDVHAVSSANFFEGVKMLGDLLKIPVSLLGKDSDIMLVAHSKARLMINHSPMENPYGTFDALRLQGDGEVVNMLVFHPGYIDQRLLAVSSLTTQRSIDAWLLCSEEFKDMLRETGIESVTYRDL